MDYNKFKIEDLNYIIPNSSSVNLDNLSENEKMEYILLYNLYRKLFTEYIIEQLNLNYYDEKMKNSGCEFRTVSEENMDIYQHFSSERLKYFYIRNNIYIEKLTREQLDFFRKKLKDGETKKVIEETYRKVILEDFSKNGEKGYVLFGPDNTYFLANNDSIIIGIRYDQASKSEIDDDMWFDRFTKQKRFLNGLLKEMESAFSEKGLENIKIINYDDYSVYLNEKERTIMEGEER